MGWALPGTGERGRSSCGQKRLLWGLALLMLALSGCVQRSHTPRVAADWSRGALLGISSGTDQPAMALTADSGRLLIAWPARSSANSPEVIHTRLLDTISGEVVSEHDLPAPSGDPRMPILSPAGAEGFHLLWLEGPYTQRVLNHVLLTPDGAPAGPTVQLSEPGRQVLQARAAALPDGGMAVLWTSATDLSMRRIDVVGTPQGEPLHLPNVLYADVAADSHGTIHLAWLGQASPVRFPLYTAVLDSDLSVSHVYTLTSIVIDDFQLIEDDIGGPVLAPAQEGLYVVWWTAYDWGLGQNQGIAGARLHIPPARRNVEETSRVIFALVTEETVGDPQSPFFPSTFPPVYEPVEGVTGLSELAPSPSDISTAPLPGALSADSRAGALVYQVPTIVRGSVDQARLVFSLQVRTRSRVQLQPSLAILDQGRMVGYAVVGWTEKPTTAVSAVADSSGSFYVSWVDSTGIVDQHPIYLATTSERLRPVLNRLTAADILAILGEVSDRAIRGFVFLLIVAPVLIVPLVWFLLMLWLGGGELSGRGGVVVLLVALGLHLAGKYLITGQLLSSLPLLGYLPSNIVPLLIYLTPVVTLGIGWGLAWLIYSRRHRSGSPMPMYLIAGCADLVLSLSLYGLGSFE